MKNPSAMRKTLCALPLLLAVFCLQAQTVVNFNDYTAAMGGEKNAKVVLEKILKDFEGKDGVTISFPEGRYDFYPSVYRQESPYEAGIKIEGAEGLTIEGNGSEFIFHGMMEIARIHGCSGVTLKDFSVDWERPLLTQCTVVQTADDYIDVTIDGKAYPWYITDGRIRFTGEGWDLPIDPSSYNTVYTPDGEIAFNTWDMTVTADLHKARAEQIGADTVRFHCSQPYRPAPGSIIELYHRRYAVSGISASHTRDLLFENITIFHSMSHGIACTMCENVSEIGVRIIPNKAKGRVFSTVSDASHFANCKGDIVIRGCECAGQGDDFLNVHGRNCMIDSVDGSTVSLADSGHASLFAPGDKVAFVGRKSGQREFELTVKDAGDGRVTFTEQVPEDVAGTHVLENMTWTASLLFEDNVVTKSNRARGILVTTPRTSVIRNNVFRSAGTAILIEGDTDYWFESGACGDLTITGNVFDNCLTSGNRDGDRWQWGDAVITITPSHRPQDCFSPAYHRNIKITGNEFRVFDTPLVRACSVDGLTFEGNEIIKTDHYRPYTYYKDSFVLEGCRNVRIAGNDFDPAYTTRTVKGTIMRRSDVKASGLRVMIAGHRPKKIWCVAEKDNDLIGLLKDLRIKVSLQSTAAAALKKARPGGAVMLLDYRTELTEDQLAAAEAKGLRLYAEMATLPGQTAQPDTVSVERAVVTGDRVGSLDKMDLLSINRGIYLRVEAKNPIVVLARVAGFDTAVFGLDDTPSTPLLYSPADKVIIATSVLSEFAKKRFMPETKWQPLWEYILSELMGGPVHFDEWPTQVKPAYSADAALPADAKVKAVAKGTEWFFNGHFLIHPSWKADWVDRYMGDGTDPVGPGLPDDAPDGDGTLGMLEGHTSAIWADGRQGYRYWLRDDVQGESSMAFALAGKLLDNPDYTEISKNLSDYSFKEFRDGPRSDPSSPTYGLLGWAYTHKWVYYGDDNARSILGTIMAAAVTGEHRWDRMIMEAIDANLNTAGRLGFRGPRLHEEDIQANGLEWYQKRDIFNPHPHFESWLWACYLWAYAKTGDRKYYDAAESGLRLTMAAYPDGWNWTNGIQQERGRIILPLAWLYRVSPTEEHKAWIDTVIGELERNQQDCGAIREELGDPSKGQFGTQTSNDQYGRGEAPLIFQNGDPVADMLYTCNFAVFGLNEAACATDDPRIRRMADSLADFLVRIQARSDSYRSLDGAWYRAFNYRNWDYWASNADAGWGNLGTLTGWTQSWIISTLALIQMQTSYWDVTAK